MKINTKRVVSVIITAVMLVVMLPSFARAKAAESIPKHCAGRLDTVWKRGGSNPELHQGRRRGSY